MSSTLPSTAASAAGLAETSLPDPLTDATPLTIHVPIATHSVALWILATCALIFALDWAQLFLITPMLGIFLLIH